MKICVHQDCVVTTHPIHGIVRMLVSCIQNAYDIVGAPQSCQCLALYNLQQLLQWFQTQLPLAKSVQSNA